MTATTSSRKPFGYLFASIARTSASLAGAVALLMLPGAAHAQYQSEESTSFGGPRFNSPCRPNDVLVGVDLRYGKAVDAVTAICSPLNPERTQWAGTTYRPTQAWGGPGGSPKELQCQPGDAVHVMTVANGEWGNHLVAKGVEIGCHDLDSAHYYAVRLEPLSKLNNVIPFVVVRCSDGDWATGLYGRSGDLVDSMGLLCNRIAVAAATPARVPQPAPEAAAHAPMPQAASRPIKVISAGKPVQVVLDTDTFANREGEKTGTLAAGTEGVNLRNPCQDNWCHLKWPGGEGWVYNYTDQSGTQALKF